MHPAVILLIAYLPYYLNDFINIHLTNYAAWVLLDSTVRLGIMGFLLVMLGRRRVTRAQLGLTGLPVTDMLLWTVGTGCAAMAYLWLSEFVLAPYFPGGSLGAVPFDTASSLFAFDATAGLVLVAISEEVVCRGLTVSVLRDRLPVPALYLATALLFSLMHWSLSVHTLVDAFIYGLLLMPALLATGSVWPGVVVHFLVNFVLYHL
jgi:membrane protease YdiL (CAAX protease family)